jgi:hypothetical protein
MKSLIWRNATRTHDWMDLQIPLRLLETWLSLGLVTNADWFEGRNGRQRKVSIAPGALASELRKQRPAGKNNSIVFSVGGSTPRPWSVTAYIFPATEGMCLFNLNVDHDDKDAFVVPPPQNFIDMYTPDMVDAAYIHAEPQWGDLADGPYKPPLVTAPTFAGVFWANFLGPGHLADFDVAKIQSIEAYRTKWHGKTGLAVVSAPTLDDALTPDGEKELLRLTAEFRAAKVD